MRFTHYCEINLPTFVHIPDNMISFYNFYSEITCYIMKPVYLSSQNESEMFQKVAKLIKFKSQPLYQRYKSNLPTSLTRITLYNYKLLALGTCCGLLYGL